MPTKLFCWGDYAEYYDYLADGTKVRHAYQDGQERIYAGSLVYDQGVFESAPFGGGRIVATTGNATEVRYFLTDHLGSVRVVATDKDNVLERNDYQPFGKRWNTASLPVADNRYRFSGKEDQAFVGLPFSDYGTRMYDSERMRWLTQDPLMEKYYSIGQYNYCMGNPIRHIDPMGLDIWEIHPDGNIVTIEDDNIARISFVNADGNETNGYEFDKEDISYREDKDQDGNSIYIFEIKGDDKAEDIYNRALVHTQNTKEFELVRIGDQNSEKNIIGTSNQQVQSGVGPTLLNNNYTIREHYHNHPSGNNIPSKNDKKFAEDTRKYFPNASFYINTFQKQQGRTHLTKKKY